jgi:hypothetical protein
VGKIRKTPDRNRGRFMNRKLLVLAAVASFAATPAFAVVSPFGGPASGVDPLGNVWSASGTHWGEPGYLSGTQTFNSAGISNSAGSYATSFSFTFLKGVAGTIDQSPSFTPFGSGPETRFSNLTDGVAWLVSFSPKTVTFTAPTTSARLNMGDSFFVNVAFTGLIDPARFSFAALWDDSAVASPTPEPANWAMMLVGFGVLGGVMRSQRRRMIPA